MQQGARTGERCVVNVCVGEKEIVNYSDCKDDQRCSKSEWREQHKGACGKAVCMDRKQLGIPQKHEKVSKDFGGKEAPNLDLYFLVV